MRNQHYITPEPINVNAKGGTTVIVHPSFNYKIAEGKVDSLYMAWGVTSDQQIQGKLLEATLLTSMREITNSWTIDSLLNNRSGYDAALESAMDNKLNPYVHLFQFTSGVQPDPAMAAAISDKAGSIQRALAAENKKRETQALADLKVIAAKGDASALVATAQGEAEANRLRQQSLTPLLVQQKFIEQWNGVLPVYGTTPQLFKDVSK